MEQDRGIADEDHGSGLRNWSEPRLESLDVGSTRSGNPSLDEELIPQTNPPS